MYSEQNKQTGRKQIDAQRFKEKERHIPGDTETQERKIQNQK